jgi:hypothetical protein
LATKEPSGALVAIRLGRFTNEHPTSGGEDVGRQPACKRRELWKHSHTSEVCGGKHRVDSVGSRRVGGFKDQASVGSISANRQSLDEAMGCLDWLSRQAPSRFGKRCGRAERDCSPEQGI